MLVLKGLVGLHRTFNFSFFSITGWDVDLDYCDIEWFALETNRDHSVVFETASKYGISDSFVDLQDLLELIPKKDVLFIIGDWNAKVGSQETPAVTGKFCLEVKNEAGLRLIGFVKITHWS